MSLAGGGVVAIWHDLLPEARDEFGQWHNREHMPERLAIPGFRRGRRYVALQGAPEYFNLYEADSPEVLAGPDYLQRLNAPTPWTRRVVASFRNVSRAVARVLCSAGVGQGGTMLTLRFDLPAASQQALARQLCGQLLPALAERPGVVGAHLCRSDDAVSRIDTVEKQARADATQVPAWFVLLEGTGAAALEDSVRPLHEALQGHAPVPPAQAIYRLEFERGKRPSGDR